MAPSCRSRRQRWHWTWALILATTASASSQSKSRPLQHHHRTSSTCSHTKYLDDDSSYYTSTTTQDPWEEEDRVLSALARIQDTDTPYRPKTRTLKPSTPVRSAKAEAPPAPRKRKAAKKRRAEPRKAALKSTAKVSSETATTVRSSRNVEREEKIASVNKPTRDSDVRPTKLSPSSSVHNRTNGTSVRATGLPLRPSRTTSLTAAAWAVPQHQDRRTATQAAPSSTKQTSTSSSSTPWIRKFLAARPKDVLLPVPKEYISDGFNLAQLAAIVERIGFQAIGEDALDIARKLVELPPPQPSYPIYRLALRLILSQNEEMEQTILQHPLIPPQAIQQAAEALYLMVHARFVASPRGLDALRRILCSSPVFGKCARVSCEGTPLLPYGTSQDYASNQHVCQRYCPRCGNFFNFWESKTDGSAWGPSLCHLLLLAHGTDLYAPSARQSSTTAVTHAPKVMGFQLHPATKWGQSLDQSTQL